MGLCLSGVLPDGVWSEWGYAQWGFVCLPYLLCSFLILLLEKEIVLNRNFAKMLFIFIMNDIYLISPTILRLWQKEDKCNESGIFS